MISDAAAIAIYYYFDCRRATPKTTLIIDAVKHASQLPFPSNHGVSMPALLAMEPIDHRCQLLAMIFDALPPRLLHSGTTSLTDRSGATSDN
jgi:hypothetical protein